jgi:hypothetical protein
LATKLAKYENGMCRWNELIRSQSLILPEDPEQIPDIFIYLLNSSNSKPVCFTRVKPYDPKTGYFIGFVQPAKWHLLEEDKVVNALNDGDFPGSLLVKLGFGRAVEADNSADDWGRCNEKAKRGSPFQVYLRFILFLLIAYFLWLLITQGSRSCVSSQRYSRGGFEWVV